MSLLSGQRQKRSDRLEVTSPKALARIDESIMFRTQPSPCATKVKHDYTPGNHGRSEVDNSLTCVYPDRCITESVRFMMGTKLDLYHACMADLQEAYEHAQEIDIEDSRAVEVAHISRASFDKLVPFFVVEQSLRCCICVHCYRAKLITIALRDLWLTLHQGATPGAPCACDCDLCKDGECATFLPYASSKAVNSMGNLSDLLMCDKEELRTAQDGTRVEAHRSVCISGQCLHCRHKQGRFFGCPQNKGDAQRRVHPSTLRTGSSTPPGEVQWKIFTDVDERGNAITSGASLRRRRSQHGDGNDDDDDYDPLAGARSDKNKKAVAEKKGSVDDFMVDLKDILYHFIKHRCSTRFS